MRTHTKAGDLEQGIIDGSQLKPQQWQFLEDQAFTGFDNDANMVKIAILNLYLHKLDKAHVLNHNPLTTTLRGQYPGSRYDVILANPPFAGKIQRESILSDINLDTRNTELLFLKWFLDHVADKGRAGIILPEGVVLGQDRASKHLRRLLVEENQLEAVIALPHSSFKPYASVATFILVFQHGGTTSKTWMYQLSTDGFSQDGLRQPVPENDIPDLLSNWANRFDDSYSHRSGKHGWVDVAAIREHEFDLAPRHYLSPQTYAAQYPLVTIDELCDLSKGTTPAARAEPGPYPLVTTAEELKTSVDYQFDDEAVCVPLVSSTGHGHASIKRITFMSGQFAAASIVAVLRVKDRTRILPRFLYAFLESQKDDVLVPLMKGAANVSLSLEKIASVLVPLPPIEEQSALIADLDSIEQDALDLRGRLEQLTRDRVAALSSLRLHFAANEE